MDEAAKKLAEDIDAEALGKIEHAARHVSLHKGLDELAADFITHNRDKLLSTTTVLELMKWSSDQMKEPTE